MLGFAKKFIGSSNDRKVKGFMAQVQKINALEDKFAALSDGELRMMTDAFRDRLAKGESLDKLLNEAFAVVREASKRVLGQRQYDVQLTGGMILHEGGIAEMRTGEGKTLVAVAPVYLNALAGKGVQVTMRYTLSAHTGLVEDQTRTLTMGGRTLVETRTLRATP